MSSRKSPAVKLLPEFLDDKRMHEEAGRDDDSTPTDSPASAAPEHAVPVGKVKNELS